MKLSVIFPVHESEHHLVTVIEKALDIVSREYSSFELICIDDGSRDQSWDVIKRLSNQYLQVRGIRLSRNFGQWPATLCGFQEATGTYLLCLDDDGQQNPADGLRLLKMVINGSVDVAFGVKDAFRDRWLDQVFQMALGKRHNSNFVALRREVVTSGRSEVTLKMCLDAHLKWTIPPQRIGHLFVQLRPRIRGKSGYKYFGRIRLIPKNLLTYCGVKEWGGVLLTLSMILIWFFKPLEVLGCLAGFLGLVTFIYLNEIFLSLKGKPYYWIKEKWPQN